MSMVRTSVPFADVFLPANARTDRARTTSTLPSRRCTRVQEGQAGAVRQGRCENWSANPVANRARLNAALVTGEKLP